MALVNIKFNKKLSSILRAVSYISCDAMRSHFGTLQRVSQLDLRVAAVATMSNLVFVV